MSSAFGNIAIGYQSHIAELVQQNIASGYQLHICEFNQGNIAIGYQSLVPGSESIYGEYVPMDITREMKLIKIYSHVIKPLTVAGSHINERDENGRTPLHWAVDIGHLNIINDLIVLKPDLDAKDNHDDTPLHIAAYSGNTNIINTLIAAGANVHAVNIKNELPLDIIFKEGKWEAKIIIHRAMQERELISEIGLRKLLLPPELIWHVTEYAFPKMILLESLGWDHV